MGVINNRRRANGLLPAVPAQQQAAGGVDTSYPNAKGLEACYPLGPGRLATPLSPRRVLSPPVRAIVRPAAALKAPPST